MILDAKIPQKLMAEAKIPFKVCESDNKPGLTVDIVRNCDEDEDELIADAVNMIIENCTETP